VTDAGTGALITEPARHMPDMATAALPNRLGRRTGRGHSWRKAGVRGFRNRRGIPFYREGERETRGEMTLSGAAAALGANYRKARRLIQDGRPPARQPCPGAPRIVSAADAGRLRAGARASGRKRVNWRCPKTGNGHRQVAGSPAKDEGAITSRSSAELDMTVIDCRVVLSRNRRK